MHMDEARGAGSFVEIVDVLGAKEETIPEPGFEFGQCNVCRVRLSGLRRGAPGGVKLPDESGVPLQRFGSAHVFDAMAGPQPIRSAKGGQATLCADACTGEDEDAVGGCNEDRRHSCS
jgi:hypothetical protein